jgi:hypothetical protein
MTKKACPREGGRPSGPEQSVFDYFISTFFVNSEIM